MNPRNVKKINIAEREVSDDFGCIGGPHTISISLSEDSKKLFTVSSFCGIRLCCAETGKIEKILSDMFKEYIFWFTFNQGGEHLMTCDKDSVWKKWRMCDLV